MTNLRLISTIIVKDKLAIQSFNYKDYLPLGKVEIIVKNFDRWNSDEILVNCIDRSKKKIGPDFELLEKISRENILTREEIQAKEVTEFIKDNEINFKIQNV